MGNQPVLRDEAIAMGEQRLQGYRDSKELSPQAQMSIQRPSIKMGQEPNAGLPSKSIAPAQSIAPMGVEATQARLQERFGAPTISDIQAAPKGLGMQTDPQGRMIDPSVDLSSFEQASADREARQAAGTGFGQAQTRAAGTVTDRERRAARGEGMSDADRRDIAKANAPGASASDIARGGKVAELNRVDRKTGKPLAQEGAMTRAEDLAERKFQAELAENNRAWETAQADKQQRQQREFKRQHRLARRRLSAWIVNCHSLKTARSKWLDFRIGLRRDFRVGSLRSFRSILPPLRSIDSQLVSKAMHS